MKFLYYLIFTFFITISNSFSNNNNGFIWEKYLRNDSVSYYLLDRTMIKVNDNEFITIDPCEIVGNFHLIFTKIDSDGNILKVHNHFYYKRISILASFDIKTKYIYDNHLYVITIQASIAGEHASHLWRFDLNKFEVDKIVSDSTFRESVVDYVFDKDKIIQLGVKIENERPVFTQPLIRIFDKDFNIIETIDIDTTGLGFKITDHKTRGFMIYNTILTKDNNIFTYINSFDTIDNKKIFRFVPVKISKDGKIIWSLFNEIVGLETEIFQTLHKNRTIQLENGDIVSLFLGSFDFAHEGLIKISQDGQIRDFKIFKDNSKLKKRRFFFYGDFQFIEELKLYVIPGYQSEQQKGVSQIVLFLNQDFDIVLDFETNVIVADAHPIIRSLYYLGNWIFLIYASDGKTDSPYLAKIKLEPTSITENINLNSKIRLFPQPANDYLYVDIESVTEVQGKIYNINGVFLKTISIGVGEIFIGDLANGTYYLIIANQTFKFIKF